MKTRFGKVTNIKPPSPQPSPLMRPLHKTRSFDKLRMTKQGHFVILRSICDEESRLMQRSHQGRGRVCTHAACGQLSLNCGTKLSFRHLLK